MALKAGYKGKVKIGATTIGGSTTWSYSGAVRELLEDTEFGDEHKTFIPGQIEGGEISITGNYLMDEDTGQQLLKTNFDAGTAITNVLLYLSETDSFYMSPDDTTTPASFVTITNYDAVANDKSGVGTFTCTMKVSGKLKPTY